MTMKKSDFYLIAKVLNNCFRNDDNSVVGLVADHLADLFHVAYGYPEFNKSDFLEVVREGDG